MEIRHFGAKLRLLLDHDSVITTRTRLAEELGIGPPQISRWSTGGDDGLRIDRVPARHVDAMCRLFHVGRDWLQARPDPNETMAGFEARLEMLLRRRPQLSEFRQLLMTAPESDALRIHRAPGSERRRHRGLSFPYGPDTPFGPAFHPGDRVWLELKIEVPWTVRPAARDAVVAHLTLLLTGGGRTQCFCPVKNDMAPDPRVRDAVVHVPVDAPKHLLEVDTDAGVHTLLAILAREPFSDAIAAELRSESCSDSVLEQIALTLRGQPADAWTCLRRRYYVAVRHDPVR